MKYLLILSLLPFTFMAKSQCCPYINNVEVIPSSPTTADFVKIVTTVTTPNQGMLIYSSFTLSGDTINVEACYYSGFLTATQTYIDTLNIGTLGAGNYTLDFTAYQASDTICNYTDTISMVSSFSVSEQGGLPEVSMEVGEIYPNPSSGLFTIELPDELPVEQLVIRSISGKVVHRCTFKTEMNLDLNSGTYFVEFWEGDSILGYQRIMID